MCGRYAASKSTDELVEELEIEADHTAEPVRSMLKRPQQPPAGDPDYNVAPSKNARVVLERVPRAAPAGDGISPAGREPVGPDAPPVRQLRLMTWGLVPSWAKDPGVGSRMTNARAETLLDKPAFRKAALARRLIVPADGWYEWQVSPTATDAKGKPRKQPFFMHRRDGDLTALAGLYEFWRDPDRAADDPDAWLTTFTIITGVAEPGLERIHDRQPLVLDRADWAAWLDPDLTGAEAIRQLVAPREPGRFDAYPIGRDVGSSQANGPGLLRPLERTELVGVVDPATGEVIGG
ncbi:MAG: SOS response-associated peptidase [Actinobacteria bacterium]|nr:SOS response-associated peptidase [Actinomycetota bacterium]